VGSIRLKNEPFLYGEILENALVEQKESFPSLRENIPNFGTNLNTLDMSIIATTRKAGGAAGRPAGSELAALKTVVKDSFSLVMAARQGISAATAIAVAGLLHLHPEQLADILNITSKTLRTYRQEQKNLNPAHSEQTLKLLALHLRGQQVFGEADAFVRWLEKPSYGLDDQVPLTLLETSGGIDLVLEELDRIAYGDLA
jgi:putative toxin-antitoxin system antitoxin component (TIGR02293 family)